MRFFILGLDLVVFAIGQLIFKLKDDPKKKKITLVAGIILLISSLVFFKYTNLIIDLINTVSGGEMKYLNIVMPLGISFFIFSFIHYLVDIYMGKIQKHSFKDFLLFSFFYPTIVSGPIKRFSAFLSSFQKITLQIFMQGFFVILMGYFYKFVIADTMVPLTDILQNPASASQYSMIISLYAYSIRLFFDFAGYSLIAIGCALLLGYEVPQNFNKPYIAKNPSDFWRRWHMSLTTWIRDYIYIVLGGNRAGKFRTILNGFIVMAIIGLWHGSSLNFLAWGLYHAVLLAVYNLTFRKWKLQNKAFGVLGILVTFHLVTFGWIFFATDSLQNSLIAIGKIFLT
ncbi:MBOAT family protein [Patescibacteria group bacterium]|nr:MBOAT family protein [Patescibacteria group bacterium]